MDKELKAYLLSDRQWTRPLRIAHAQFMLNGSRNDSDKTFWEAVLKANEDDQ